MDKYRVFAAAFIFLIIVSCSEKSNNPVDSSHYPVQLNALWEYSTKHFIENYDSIGNLSDPELIISENTIVQIVSDNDSLGNYKNLYHFKSTDTNYPQYSAHSWYRDSDSGLFAIAYSSAGSSQQVLPKNNSPRLYEDIRNILKRMNILYFPLNNMPSNGDSIIFNSTPAKVLQYPLFTGSSWIERTEPFSIKRNVKGKKIIELPSGTYNCWQINRTSNETFWNNITYDDYIHLNTGLITREIVIDSMIRINEPGDTVGFFKLTSYSELVRKE